MFINNFMMYKAAETIFNINGLRPLIFHFNGSINPLYQQFISTNIGYGHILCPDNLTIVYVENEVEKFLNDSTYIKNELLLYLLYKYNINSINGYYIDSRFSTFSLINKSRYFLHGLKQVKTEYTLLLDSRDTKINTLDNIIDIFKTYHTRILFGGECNNYPILHNKIETIVTNYNTHSVYANTGCIIGYTKDCINFFQKLVDELDLGYLNNQYLFNKTIDLDKELNRNDKARTIKKLNKNNPAFLGYSQYTYDIDYPNITLLNTGDQGHIRSKFNNYDHSFINIDFGNLIFLNTVFTNIYLN